jgi:thiol-disulfide isomerase/thioredoxin
MKNQAFYIFAGVIVVALALIYFYGISKKSEGFSSDNKNTFTMYYVDWCPHCTHAKPDFEALRDASPVDINGQQVEFSMVNPEKTPELTKGKPIKGYPTIILTKAGGQSVEYSGERNKGGYMSFLQSNL